ncbi:MAG: hypothetical protein J5641_04920 [Bacteroidales bacterium]|nr:hypothetical protein [Bacteroidales bacterium]
MNQRKFTRHLLVLASCLIFQIAGTAHAQEIRYIYHPGDGEHQVGLILGSNIGSQTMDVTFDEIFHPINNSLGFLGGIFWGYETDHGTTFDFGAHSSLLYSFFPFVGMVPNAYGDPSKVAFNAQQARFHYTPFLAYRATQQLILNAGIGAGINVGIPSQFKLDGTTMGKNEFNILTQIFVDFDANLGAKYYFTDDLFVGVRLQYAFYSFDIRDLMESDLSHDIVGAISFSDEDGPRCVYLPSSKPFQVLFTFGHLW